MENKTFLTKQWYVKCIIWVLLLYPVTLFAAYGQIEVKENPSVSKKQFNKLKDTVITSSSTT